MDDMPQWIFALSIVLASRDVFAVVANIATGKSETASVCIADLLFALPIYGFLWGWW